MARMTDEAGSGRVPRWAADAVTLGRIALLPVFMLAADATNAAVGAGLPSAGRRTVVLLLLLTIGASDKVDGWLARRSKQPPTRRGAILDATADRIAQWAGVWFFTTRALPAFTPLPVWLAGALAVREALLLAIWIRHRRARGVSFEHELHGKAATVAVFLALFAATASARPALTTAAAALAGGAVAYSAVRYATRMIGAEPRPLA